MLVFLGLYSHFSNRFIFTSIIFTKPEDGSAFRDFLLSLDGVIAGSKSSTQYGCAMTGDYLPAQGNSRSWPVAIVRASIPFSARPVQSSTGSLPPARTFWTTLGIQTSTLTIWLTPVKACCSACLRCEAISGRLGVSSCFLRFPSDTGRGLNEWLYEEMIKHVPYSFYPVCRKNILIYGPRQRVRNLRYIFCVLLDIATMWYYYEFMVFFVYDDTVVKILV